MNSCESIRGQMTAYLAGELPDSELAAFRAHLDACPGCRNEMDELSETWSLTKRLLKDTACEGALPEEQRRAVRTAAESPRSGFRFRPAPALWKIAALFVACGAILVLVIHSSGLPSKTSPVPAAAPAVLSKDHENLKPLSNESIPAPAAEPRELSAGSLKSCAAVLPAPEAKQETAADREENQAVPRYDSAVRMKARASVAKKSRMALSGNEDELELPFADFSGLSKRDVKSILEFFREKNILLNEENISLSANPKKFRVKASPEVLRLIRVCQKEGGKKQ